MIHPLLVRAHRYERREVDLSPARSTYDVLTGAWRSDDDGGLTVDRADRQGPHTKKMDIETGEDHKGE